MSQLVSLHTKTKVLVTVVKSDGLFFVQLDTPDAYTLTALSEELAKMVQSHHGKRRAFLPSPGSKCCARSLVDGNWYRALILDSNPSTCTVYFVDYGNTESNLPISRLFPAISKYFEMPYQAVQCKLANFVPNGETWSDEAIAALTDNILNQEIPALFYGELPDYSSQLTECEIPCYLTTLYWEESDDTYTVSDELVAMGMGTFPRATPDEILSVPKSKIPTAKNDTGVSPPSAPSNIAKTAPPVNEYIYLSMDVGSEYRLYVSYAESPSVVWCQLADRTDELESMVTQLQEQMVFNGATQILEDSSLSSPLATDQPCCIQYAVDGNWCRGRIEEVEGETLVASVLFVDYGNTEMVPVSEVFSLPAQFFNIPVQALSFSVQGIQPVGGVEEAWSPQAIARFEQLYSEQELTGFVEGLDENGYPSVRLRDSTLGYDLGQLLIQEKLATPTRVTAKPSTTVPRADRKSVSPDRSSTSSGSSKSKKVSVPSFTDPTVPIGRKLTVYVTHIETLSKFYCQIQDQSEELEKLMDLINQHCSSSDAQPVAVALQNLPVLAKFSEDEKWYRALLVPPAAEGTSQWGVVFVDYGNFERVNLHKIMSLPEPFLRLPVQAYECTLANVPEKLSKDESMIDAFSDLVLDQPVECVVTQMVKKGKKNRNTQYLVSLSLNGTDIMSLLNSSPPSSVNNPPVESVTAPPVTAPVATAPSPLSNVPSSTVPSSLSTVPSLSVPTDRAVPVVICYIESPLKFFCQILSNSDAIKSMVLKMNEHYYSTETPPTLVKPVSGAFCAALFDQDEQWYRGQIVNAVSQKEVSVLFIDYGNSEVVPLAQTRELTPEFFSLPNQAVGCCLDGFPSSLASKETNSLFESLCLDSTCQAYFQCSDARVGASVIACKLVDSSTGELVVNLLKPKPEPVQSSQNTGTSPKSERSIRSDVSTRSNEARERKPKVAKDPFNSSKDDRLSRSQHPNNSREGKRWSNSRSSNSSGSSHREHSLESRNSKRSNESFRNNGKAPQREHDHSKSSSRDSSRSLPDTISSFTPILTSSLYGLVTHIVSPAEFYVQPSVSSVRFKKMTANLSQYYGQDQNGEPCHSPLVNSFCCVAIDGLFRRCKVKEIADSNQVIVFSVDYGSTHTVQLKDVFVLANKFYSLPTQAVCCSLSKFSCDSQDAMDDVVENMTRSILNREVEVTFDEGCRHGNVYEVEVVLRQSLTDLLLSKKREAGAKKIVASSTNSSLSSYSSSDATPPFLLVLPGCKEEGVVTGVSDSGHIYVQLTSCEKQLDELIAAIASFVTNPLQVMSPSSPNLKRGAVLLGQFTSDDCWYRVIIQEIVNDSVNVLYADFGNHETLPLTRLHPIAPHLLSYPRQALECQLEGVEGYHLSPGAVDVLDGELCDATCTVNVIRADANGQHLVRMILTEDSRDVSLWVLKTGLFVPTKKTISSASPLSTPLDTLSPSHVPNQTSKVVAPALTNQTQEEPAGVLKMYPITSGDAMSVYLSHKEDDKSIWVTPAAQSVELEALSELLEETYAAVNPDLVIQDPQTSQACCAKYSDDDRWYRAMVMRPRSPGGGTLVLFVDYGNQEVVDTIYKLQDEFLSLPMSAIRCRLDSSSRLPSSDWEEPVTFQFTGKESPNSPVWLVRVARPSLVDAQLPSPYPRPPSPVREVTVPSLQLKEDDKHQVYISHTESPNLFYCQLVSESEALEEIMAQIADYYTDKVLEVELEAGSYCVACYSRNNTWYRARILKVMAPEVIEVLFVDYGNQEELHPCKIQGLERRFTHLPCQAFACSLLSTTSGQFSEDQLETFFSLNVDEESFEVCLKRRLDGNSWYVELRDQRGECINELFLSSTASLPVATDTTQTTPSYYAPHYQPGSHVDVFVTCVNGPDNFYCQPLELASQLEELMNEISAHMSSDHAPMSLPLSSMTIGQPCLARYTSTSDWYRGQIDTDQDSNQVVVRYVDYGNLALLGQEQVTSLPTQFLKVPTQALQCSVMSVGDETPPKVGSDVTDKFLRTLCEEEHYTLTILSCNEHKYFVEVSDSNGTLDFSFLSNYNTSLSLLASIDQKDSDEKDLLDESPLHAAGTDSLLKSSKSPLTDLEESEEDSANTGEPLIHAPCKLSLVASEVLLVTVVHVKDPSLLYLQRNDCILELDSLSSEIAQYCTDCAGQLYQQSYHHGDFVLAQYSLDLNWYRAHVIESTPESSFKVQFIDYGNIEVVSSKDMIMCPGNFLELPVQAIPCSLAQVPSREGWPDEYRQMLVELTQDRNLQATVLLAGKQGIPASVSLVDVEAGLDIVQKVLQRLDEECEAGVAPDSKVGKDLFEGEQLSVSESATDSEEKLVAAAATEEDDPLHSSEEDVDKKIEYLREKLESVIIDGLSEGNENEDSQEFDSQDGGPVNSAMIQVVSESDVLEEENIISGENLEEVMTQVVSESDVLEEENIISGESLEEVMTQVVSESDVLEEENIISDENLEEVNEPAIDEEKAPPTEDGDLTAESNAPINEENTFPMEAEPAAIDKEISFPTDAGASIDKEKTSTSEVVENSKKSTKEEDPAGAFIDKEKMSTSENGESEKSFTNDDDIATENDTAPIEEMTREEQMKENEEAIAEDEIIAKDPPVSDKEQPNEEHATVEEDIEQATAGAQEDQDTTALEEDDIVSGDSVVESDSSTVLLETEEIANETIRATDNTNETNPPEPVQKTGENTLVTAAAAIDPLSPESPPDSKVLKNGAQYKVFVVNATSPYNFICHLSSYSQVLDALMSIMAQTYENGEQESLMLTAPPAIGELVCAQYSKDNTYYRAKVLNVTSDSQYHVEFLDYGNDEVVPLNRMRILHSELTTEYYPSFAIQCSLAGLPESFDASSHFVEVLVSEMFELIDDEGPALMEVVLRQQEEGERERYQVVLYGKDKETRVNQVIIGKIEEYMKKRKESLGEEEEEGEEDETMVNGSSNVSSETDLTVSIKRDLIQTKEPMETALNDS